VTTERREIEVRGISVELVRKDIKNLHLAVYPPDGHVRLAVPLAVDDEAARLSVVSRLPWIRRQREVFAQQQRQTEREMLTGESHYADGQRYRLDVIQKDGPPGVRIRNKEWLELRVRPGTDRDEREAVLYRWYRARLRERIKTLIDRWESVMEVDVAEARIRRMKTRWGSCNSEARRIWLNLELAKKSPLCVEYVVVHEMVHILEREHGKRFTELMNRFMPQWRSRKDQLNRAPLAHEDWDY